MTIRMPALLEARGLVSGVLAAGLTLVGPQLYPFPADNLLLRLVAAERPDIFAAFTYAYVALWASSAFLLFSVTTSLLYIFLGQRSRAVGAEA